MYDGVHSGSWAEPKPVRETWCGRTAPSTEWCFIDASHAALNAKHEGRLVLCPECAAAIIGVLKEHGR
jgi:hypothetical protein